MPIGHWHSSFKTGTPNISFGVSVVESRTDKTKDKMQVHATIHKYYDLKLWVSP